MTLLRIRSHLIHAGVFDSGPINAGATFQFTFSQAGTFTYHSTSDSGWTGTVTVTQ